MPACSGDALEHTDQLALQCTGNSKSVKRIVTAPCTGFKAKMALGPEAKQVLRLMLTLKLPLLSSPRKACPRESGGGNRSLGPAPAFAGLAFRGDDIRADLTDTGISLSQIIEQSDTIKARLLPLSPSGGRRLT